MSSNKAAKQVNAAERSSKLLDAAEKGDVETMKRVMSAGGELDLDVLVADEGWKTALLPNRRLTALYAAVAAQQAVRRQELR